MARFYNSGGGAGGDVSFTGEGCIVFPNDGEVCNVPNSSGDGAGYSTIQINPDTTTNDNRYIIIDPTAPNHIHIRAGGTQDGSSADLFLGGERNNVHVSDGGRDVVINTRPATVINTYTNLNPTGNTSFVVSNTANIYVGDTAYYAGGGDTVTVDSVTQDLPSAGLQTITANINGTPAIFVGGAAHIFSHEESWNNSWLFNDSGVLSGPAMGSVAVNGIYNNFTDDLYIGSSESIQISGTGGEFLNDSSIPSNQIATIGDIQNTVSDVTSYNPVWSGTGLAFTGTPAVGSYVKVGSVVTVQIDVEFDNVSNFGTGQYSLTLPFDSRYHTDVYGGSVHDVGGTTNHYSLKGHLNPNSSTMTVWSLKSSAQDEPFDHNSPMVLTTADKFHMSFTYICE
jgi:hypothetical protein